MGDNVPVTPGVGATIAADDVGGVMYQRIKVAFGVDGVATDVSPAAAFPVADAAGATALALLASQTTAAAILAKISGDPASQTTLAAVLAKIIAAPSTEAKQDTGNSTLAGILSTLQAQVDLSTTLWTDDSNAFYVRRDVIDQDSNTIVVSFTTPTGAAATPGAGLRPAANEEALATLDSVFSATAGGTGYSIGDLISRQVVVNQNTVPPTVVTSAWVNLTTGAAIAAPANANLALVGKDVTISSSVLPTGAATQTTLAALLAKIIAAPATEAKQDTIIGFVDGIEAALAGIYGRQSTDPTTSAKQDALKASMDALLAAIKPAVGHFLVVPAATALTNSTRRIVVGAAGSITYTVGGVSVTHPVVAGQTLDVVATVIAAAPAGTVGQF